MKFEMRELRGDDLFSLLNIVSKIGIQNELTSLFAENEQVISPETLKKLAKKHGENKKALEEEVKALLENALEQRGMRVMGLVLSKLIGNLSAAKNEINTLLADLCDVEMKQIRELKLMDYTELVLGVFKKPELKDFFTLLARSMR